ncbi:hypothetical protein [Palleronia sp. LCG004]|uniref:acyltransferase n=1 Tax=Palleronia sp. LCG004 TaxID=3079304 RepID=UPI002943398A|nr:hypothetical protein [Palleronia sp. LCG004]WOI58443.1 hypothetical protein RVY76_18340 [Palleronia sp. LCG004]
MIVKNAGEVRIGRRTTIEECYLLADGAKIDIGEDCMISFQVALRTTDAHGIYDRESGVLLNPPDDIRICDHVWIAQGAIVGKGSVIGKDCVVGGRSYLNKKTFAPGCLIAGAPPTVLRENIVWDRRMTDNLYAEDADVDPHNPIFRERT